MSLIFNKEKYVKDNAKNYGLIGKKAYFPAQTQFRYWDTANQQYYDSTESQPTSFIIGGVMRDYYDKNKIYVCQQEMDKNPTTFCWYDTTNMKIGGVLRRLYTKLCSAFLRKEALV